MMYPLRHIGLLVCFVLLSVSLLAQHAGNKPAKTEKPAADHHQVLLPFVYLGSSDYKGGAIQKSVFDNLMKKGLTAKDPAGNRYKVIGFEFSYGEKALYEDSIGNNIITTDYLTEYCYGDTLSAGVAASLYSRTKAGDSVYFDKIRVVKYLDNTNQTVPENEATLGMPMKFGLTK